MGVVNPFTREKRASKIALEHLLFDPSGGLPLLSDPSRDPTPRAKRPNPGTLNRSPACPNAIAPCPACHRAHAPQLPSHSTSTPSPPVVPRTTYSPASSHRMRMPSAMFPWKTPPQNLEHLYMFENTRGTHAKSMPPGPRRLPSGGGAHELVSRRRDMPRRAWAVSRSLSDQDRREWRPRPLVRVHARNATATCPGSSQARSTSKRSSKSACHGTAGVGDSTTQSISTSGDEAPSATLDSTCVVRGPRPSEQTPSKRHAIRAKPAPSERPAPSRMLPKLAYEAEKRPSHE